MGSILDLEFALQCAQTKLPVLLAPLGETHRERVPILTYLCVSLHALLQLHDVLLETLRFNLMRKDCLPFLRRLGCVNVVLAEVEHFVIDVHNKLLQRTLCSQFLIFDLV